MSESFRPTLFDIAPTHPAVEAARKRDRALRIVKENADPEWLSEALEAVRKTAERLPEFHVDSVWEQGLRGTVEDRAMGPVLRKAARLGYIRKTDRVLPSSKSHCSGKPVWSSRIYQGESA